MIAWIEKLWRKRQRGFDERFLWPTCKEAAQEVYTNVPLDDWMIEARKAFFVHCMMDDAWTKDMTSKEITDYIMKLV